MESMLFQNWFALLLVASALVLIRMRQERIEREVDALRRRAHAL